jgi:hypothetical protein
MLHISQLSILKSISTKQVSNAFEAVMQIGDLLARPIKKMVDSHPNLGELEPLLGHS